MAAISTIIMAGGLGTRMRSPLPKVLHELCGLPMLAWVGTSYAVANAHPSVLEMVDHVAPGNDEDGVAQVLAGIFDL